MNTNFNLSVDYTAPDMPRTYSSRAYINIPRDKLAEFSRFHHILRLTLFGSVLRDDFGPDSDIDVLVEF